MYLRIRLFRSMFFLSMLFLFLFKTTFAQEVLVKRSHPLSNPTSVASNVPTTGTLNVVAIMVEFQPDSNRFTTGTGIFGSGGLPFLERANDVRIEPLPHDQNYFESHLEFAKNYFEQASNGLLTINYTLLPEVFRLDKEMSAYSPIGETFTAEELGDFAKESWEKVEQSGGFDATGLDPDDTAFIIFHAGVGRDVELIGTTLTITPQDIPSVYLRSQDLAELLEEPNFDGFGINGGNFKIRNTTILPRTQSRPGFDIQDNEFVFPLSINGLLVASIGSHLGLPDLFNTETGAPGIGRFGLMDGAGFFAYNGLLPPLTSAWERTFLGWTTPFEVNSTQESTITLPAVSLGNPNSVARINLSSQEYFLVENRHRDTDNSGVTLTIRKPDGTDVQQTFLNSNNTFVFQENGFDTLFEAGSIIDVSNFDWSLPGGLDIGEDNIEGTADDRFLNGGILIWHIDEALINANLSSGTINNNRFRKGVALQEADGPQDIGAPISGSLDNSTSFGFAFDFWWSGNNYRVISQTGVTRSLYQNRFGPNTIPDNNSNTGAISFFELFDFSDNLPVGSFKIRPFEQTEIDFEPSLSLQLSNDTYSTAQDSYWDYFPLSLSIYETVSDTFLVIPGSESLTAVQISGSQNNEFLLEAIPPQQPLISSGIIYSNNPSTSYLGSNTNMLIKGIEWDELNQLFITKWDDITPVNSAFLGSQNGDTVFVDFTNRFYLAEDGLSGILNRPEFRSELIGNAFSTIQSTNVEFSTNPEINFTPAHSSQRIYSGIISSNLDTYFYVFDNETFTLVNPNSENPFTNIFSEEKAEWPAISDDLEIFRVNKMENRIEGFNRNGTFLNNFPIPAKNGFEFIGTPLLADVNNDGDTDIIITAQDDFTLNIFAFNMDGSSINGYPLFVGTVQNLQEQPIHPILYQNSLYAVSPKGDLKSWQFSHDINAKWSSRYGNNPFNKVSARIEETEITDNTFNVLNKLETYNWPNPANDFTNLRYELKAPGGTVKVTIASLSGTIIYENTVQSSGGFAEEIQINTSNWASGPYFAMVKATVNGRSESKLVKIGVLR